jgi:hypothetical protein
VPFARLKRTSARASSEAWLAMVTADEQWQALLAEDREAVTRARQPG